jgi:hypothetical protein
MAVGDGDYFDPAIFTVLLAKLYCCGTGFGLEM